MKKILIMFMIICASIHCRAQQDTVTTKSQMGFLFLTAYNFQYDWDGGEIRPLGFHDFFFPVENFDSKWIVDSNLAIVFKNGLRVDFIKNRKVLKDAASLIKGKDTSNCYEYEQFYIIPVTISYRKFEDYEPFVCRRNYFDIQVTGGSALHFEYIHYAIKPINIIPQFSKSKKRPGKKHEKTGN